MSKRRLNALFAAGLLMVATAACREAPVAPGALKSPGGASFSTVGTSEAARQCQQGGYLNLFRSDGSGFRNTGECVSYAARGGVLARRLTATFRDVYFDACNALTWGYDLNGAGHDVESKTYGCVFYRTGTTLTVSYLSTQTLRVFLRDDSCGPWTFYEDGNHALVQRLVFEGEVQDTVRITDGGGYCEGPPEVERLPDRDGGNLKLIRVITGF